MHLLSFIFSGQLSNLAPGGRRTVPYWTLGGLQPGWVVLDEQLIASDA